MVNLLGILNKIVAKSYRNCCEILIPVPVQFREIQNLISDNFQLTNFIDYPVFFTVFTVKDRNAGIPEKG
jgi:hypothetical protein